ncbi:MAG: esterase [Proteobacteria bacterium]|nr:esterase [Burkholderiales bacterium]
MIVYLHGFNSSPQSIKARLIEARLDELDGLDLFCAPALPHLPKEAIAAVDVLLPDDPSSVTFVGSSLGGFYATHLAEKHGARAVLVNPAVKPQRLLAHLPAEQENLHTKVPWQWTPRHLDELAALEVDPITRPERYLLLVETGDEVLDWRQAVEKYSGVQQVIVEGGDHGFASFTDHVDTILRFAGLLAPPDPLPRPSRRKLAS